MFYKGLSNDSTTASIFLYECADHLEGKYIWAFFSTLCPVVGLPASAVLLWEMFQTHRIRSPMTPNDLFILNLIVMDALFLTSMPPCVINVLFLKNMMFMRISNGIYALNTCGRPLVMSCVCLDCYVAVVHPVIYRQRKSLLPRIVTLAVVWTLTLASGFAYFASEFLYLTVLPLLPFITSIVMIAVCDFFIIRTLLKSDPSGRNIHAQKRRAIQTLSNSLIMAGLSYVPPVLFFAITKDLFSFQTFLCYFSYILSIVSTLGSCVMPLLALYNLGRLCWVFSCCRSQ